MDRAERFEEIYNLLYGPITTPYSYVEHAKLGNYDYVKYYKNEKGDALICEMKCRPDDNPVDGEDLIFFAHFNEKNHLQKIMMQVNGGDMKLFFDRQDELNLELQRFHQDFPSKKNAIAS